MVDLDDVLDDAPLNGPVPGAEPLAGMKSKILRDLMLAFVRVHILHHASREAVYGAGLAAELATHGYRLSWGTLYPLFHGLEDGGLLEMEERVVEGKVRKYYRITTRGRRTLTEARSRAEELVTEIND